MKDSFIDLDLFGQFDAAVEQKDKNALIQILTECHFFQMILKRSLKLKLDTEQGVSGACRGKPQFPEFNVIFFSIF